MAKVLDCGLKVSEFKLYYVHFWTNTLKKKYILLACSISKDTVTAIMMPYKDTKAMVHSSADDTNFFDIVAGVLQGDTLAEFQFIICLDNVLGMSIDLMKDNAFTLERQEADDIKQRQLMMLTLEMI